jgi:hypothetical protein
MGMAMTRVVDANGNSPPAGSALSRTNRVSDTIPDIAPAFVSMSALSDTEGLIWVRLGARTYGFEAVAPVIYGVLDASGQLIDRVSLPPRSQIGGFGPGAVYAMRPTGTVEGYMLERYRYRRR